jgi:hypothetical protein
LAIRRCFSRNDGFSIAAYLLFADNAAGRYPQRQNSVTIFPIVFVLLFSLLVEVSLKIRTERRKAYPETSVWENVIRLKPITGGWGQPASTGLIIERLLAAYRASIRHLPLALT